MSEDFNLESAIINQAIMDSKIYQEVDKLMKGAKTEHKLYLTSYLCITITIALSDNKIYQSELSYIVKSIPKGLPLEDQDKKGLVIVNFERAMYENELEPIYEKCLEYIHNELSEEQKQSFLKVIAKLSSIDGEVDSSEEKLVLEISNAIGLSGDLAKKVINSVKTNAKVIEGDKKLSSFSNIEKNETKFTRKEGLKNLISRQKMYFQGKMEDSRLYFYINLHLPNLIDEDKIFLVAYIGTLFTIVKADTIIHKNEIKLLQSKISNWFDFDDETLGTLVDLNIFLLKHRSQCYQEKFEIHLDVLNNMFRPKQIIDFCETLIEVSKADGQSVQVELDIIQKVLNALEMPEEDYLKLCEKIKL